MIYYNVLLEYVLPVVAGLIGILLIIIQGKQKLKMRPDYYDILLFTAVIAAVSLLMFIFYTREILMEDYGAVTVVRMIDYVLYAAIPYTWLRFMQRQRDDLDVNTSVKSVFVAGKLFAACGAVCFCIFAAGFMDYNYYIADGRAGFWYHCSEGIFAIIMTLLVLFCAVSSLSHILLTSVKRYVLIESLILSGYMLYQITFTGNLGETEVHGWDVKSADLSGWFLLAAIILTIHFIYRSDFQPLFVPEQKPSGTIDALTLAQDTIAEDHRLTVREREVLELIYQGSSNADIAEKLFISLSTVKTHVKNIFEKTGATSRMELVFLINNQKDQLSSK